MTADRSAATPSLGRLGPEPLSRAFDAAALARALAKRRNALKVALLDQRVVAGIGNIYASEALHLARPVAVPPGVDYGHPAGAPRGRRRRLVAGDQVVLRRAIALKESARYRRSRFRVYDREGERCPTAGCAGTIARVCRTDARRSTVRSASDEPGAPRRRGA